MNIRLCADDTDYYEGAERWSVNLEKVNERCSKMYHNPVNIRTMSAESMKQASKNYLQDEVLVDLKQYVVQLKLEYLKSRNC